MKRVFTVLVLSALIAGLVSINAVYAVIFIMIAAIGTTIIVKPASLPIIVLLISAITLDILFGFTVMGFDAGTIYKLMLLVVTLFFVMKYGLTLEYIWPLVALSLLLFLSYTAAELHPNLSPISPFIVFLGIGAPFSLLLVRWDKKLASYMIAVIPFLPLVSVAAGMGLELLGLHTLFHVEYLGAKRLQGANMGAHLAMLAFVGLCVGLIEVKRTGGQKNLYFALMGINFLIMFYTGTRGALIASSFIVIVFILDYVKDYAKGKLLALIPLLIFLAAMIAVIASQWQNILLRTFNEHSSEIGINLSGRDIAWKFFLAEAEGSEIFGNGLGASLVANDGSLFSGFTVPHNEYIRFYFDSGIIGAILFFSSLIYIILKIGKKLPLDIQVYYYSLILGVFLYSFVDNTLTTIHFVVPFCFYLAALGSIYRKETD